MRSRLDLHMIAFVGLLDLVLGEGHKGMLLPLFACVVVGDCPIRLLVPFGSWEKTVGCDGIERAVCRHTLVRLNA
jgi:hypothetical protein